MDFQIPDYSLFYIDRSYKQDGGVALYDNNIFDCT